MTFFEELGDGLADIGNIIGDHFLRIVGALIILVIGWWLGRLVRNLIDRPAVGTFFDKVYLGQPIREIGYQAQSLVATLVSGLVMLAALTLAAEATNVQPVEESMTVLTRFLPRLIGAVVILVLAVAFGRWFSRLLDPYAEARSFPWLPRIARWLFYVIGGRGALSLAGFGDETGLLIVGIGTSILVIFTIAWGVGGIARGRAWWEARQLRTE